MSESDPTAAERNKRHRDKRKAQGWAELRLWLPRHLHDRVRRYAERLQIQVPEK